MHLIDSAVAVLDRAQDAEGLQALALQIEHDVHNVLQHSGACYVARLGHVTHHEDGDAQPLGLVQQRRCALPDLCTAKGCETQARTQVSVCISEACLSEQALWARASCLTLCSSAVVYPSHICSYSGLSAKEALELLAEAQGCHALLALSMWLSTETRVQPPCCCSCCQSSKSHLHDAASAAVQVLKVHRLDGVDHERAGAHVLHPEQDVLHARCAVQPHALWVDAHPLGPGCKLHRHSAAQAQRLRCTSSGLSASHLLTESML